MHVNCSGQKWVIYVAALKFEEQQFDTEICVTQSIHEKKRLVTNGKSMFMHVYNIVVFHLLIFFVCF